MKPKVQFIFFIGIFLLQSLSWGDDNYLIKSDTSPFPSDSCIDRCHVNYMAYRTVYQGEVFRHKTHSPNQRLECSQCHNNDAVNTKTHGGLVIKQKDCMFCHHKEPSDENCQKCHADVKDYMNGSIQNLVIKISDWMSQSVSCKNCHKLKTDGTAFKAVREYCTECHNEDYGLLYDAWKETLNSKIKKFSKNDTNIINMQNPLRLVQSYGMHNFRLSLILLRSIEQ